MSKREEEEEEETGILKRVEMDERSLSLICLLIDLDTLWTPRKTNGGFKC